MEADTSGDDIGVLDTDQAELVAWCATRALVERELRLGGQASDDLG